MPWVKLDDAIFTDEAMMAAGADGRLLFIAGLCHASRNLTDGAIDKRALQAIAALVGADPAAADLLVELGLWVEEGSMYRAPHYLDFNPPADKVRAEREAAKQRMAAKRSGEVQPNTDGSSGTPVPSPSRPDEPSSSSSTVNTPGLPDDLWTKVAEKKSTLTTSVIANPAKWKAKAAANARDELEPRALSLAAMYDLTTPQLVDALCSPTNPPWVNHHRRRDTA